MVEVNCTQGRTRKKRVLRFPLSSSELVAACDLIFAHFEGQLQTYPLGLHTWPRAKALVTAGRLGSVALGAKTLALGGFPEEALDRVGFLFPHSLVISGLPYVLTY